MYSSTTMATSAGEGPPLVSACSPPPATPIQNAVVGALRRNVTGTTMIIRNGTCHSAPVPTAFCSPSSTRTSASVPSTSSW